MKISLFSIVLAALLGGLTIRSQQAEATAPQLSTIGQEAILAATVQIAMFEHATEEGAAERGSQGLGTVVAYGGERLIVTHDHWSHLTPNLKEVEIRNAHGQLLRTLHAEAFNELIAYRDGGTMVLRTPAELKGLSAATPGAPVVEGDVVWFARRDADSGRATVEVVAATVTAVDGASAPASMRLRNLDGTAVIPGDSGGGVWANGRLLGNLWAAGVNEERSLWTMLSGGNVDAEPSNLTIVALQPLG